MDFTEEKIVYFMRPLELYEMDFKLGEFSDIHNSTLLTVDIKMHAIKERFNNAFGIDAWNVDIPDQNELSSIKKGSLNIKADYGDWISKKVSVKVDLKENISVEDLLLKKVALDLNIGGKILEMYPVIYLLGNLKGISKVHLDEIKAIHEIVCSKKKLPEVIKIGTGKNIFETIVINNSLSSKQINFISAAADIFGEKGKVQDQILKGEISKDNFFTNILRYGYTIERADNKLSNEQLDQLKKIAVEYSDILSTKGYDIGDDIESGRINNANYDEILENYLQLIKNENNLGYQR